MNATQGGIVLPRRVEVKQTLTGGPLAFPVAFSAPTDHGMEVITFGGLTKFELGAFLAMASVSPEEWTADRDAAADKALSHVNAIVRAIERGRGAKGAPSPGA